MMKSQSGMDLYKPELQIPGLTVSDMQLVIKFLYTGYAKVTDENLDMLVALAEKLDIPLLKSFCLDHKEKVNIYYFIFNN